MDEEDQAHDAFRSDQFWKGSALFEDPQRLESTLFAPLQLDVSAIKFDHPYASKHDLEHELRLPGLETFEFGPLPELEDLDEHSISIETPSLQPDEDVWEKAFELGPANKDILFYTWEAFESRHHSVIRTPYITERGPEAFDAALAADDHKVSAGKVLKGDVLLQSLWNLGLGRTSILFTFNPKSKSFEAQIPDGRPSGISLKAAQSVTTKFIHTGNTFLYLRSFAERTFAAASAIPARVALATSISSILSTLEDRLGNETPKIASLAQLQHLFAKPHDILVQVARMVEATKHANANEELASIFHHHMLELDENNTYLRPLFGQILRLIASPTLDAMGEWIGLHREQQVLPLEQRLSFIDLEDGSGDVAIPEYTYRSEMMPRFITPEDGDLIFETGKSLRFLKSHHPDHPLVQLDTAALQPPKLDWAFEWQDIESIAGKAKAFEDRLRDAILDFGSADFAGKAQISSPSPKHKTTSDKPYLGQNLEAYFDDCIQQMNAPPQSAQGPPNELHLLVSDVLEANGAHRTTTGSFSPPLALAATLSFRPLLSAQAKLVNAATIRLFLRSHQLRLHLSLQRQYQLLGDGVFSSLLATALFDPDRESAERHKGRMRSGVHMGLLLGSRTSWPPASSELRLALRGVLSESYYSSVLYHSNADHQGHRGTTTTIATRANDELPGQLNFAIRHLSEVEQEKVMDPDALPALDFLRLQYVPPTPLNFVITNSCLDKYDVIFKFLLRLLRMLFVVSHLPRRYDDCDSSQFRLEAHRFVTVLADYVFQSGIADHWNAFDALLSKLETRLSDEDSAHELGTRVTEGIAFLRVAHEECLDNVMLSLLLRRRQRKVMALVDDIFEHILLFAKSQNNDSHTEKNASDLHAKLKGKIRVFLSVCKSLIFKKGYSKDRGTGEDSSIERLVVALEMNTYFSGA